MDATTKLEPAEGAEHMHDRDINLLWMTRPDNQLTGDSSLSIYNIVTCYPGTYISYS